MAASAEFSRVALQRMDLVRPRNSRRPETSCAAAPQRDQVGARSTASKQCTGYEGELA
jgi:hypothetical protein